MKRLFGILALMVCASIMIAGCVQPGGNETATPGTTTPGATETPATTETPAATETPATTETATGTQTTPAANATETPPAPPAVSGEAVSITAGGFVPDTLTIPPDTTVTWTNNAATNETVTATGVAGFFSSGILQPGDSYNYTFAESGNYTYASETTGIIGTIVVTDDNTTS